MSVAEPPEPQFRAARSNEAAQSGKVPSVGSWDGRGNSAHYREQIQRIGRPGQCRNDSARPVPGPTDWFAGTRPAGIVRHDA